MKMIAQILAIIASLTLLIQGFRFLNNLEFMMEQNSISTSELYGLSTLKTLAATPLIGSTIFGLFAAIKAKKEFLYFIGLHLLLMVIAGFISMKIDGYNATTFKAAMVALILLVIISVSYWLFSQCKHLNEFRAM